MTKDELVIYLANLVSISGLAGEITPDESEAIEQIRQEIGASKSDLKTGIDAVVQRTHQITPVGRFSDRVRNLEDMVLVSIADGKLSESEKPEILSFAKTIKVSQKQIKEILAGSKLRLKSGADTVKCASCGQTIPGQSKFCPQCGAGVE